MERLTTHLTLAPDAPIDLHMHTNYSDGRWPAQQLIEYLVAEGFALVSVTDHDRVDTVASIQELAARQNLPVLAGVEMSTEWKGKMGHVLCYGFDPEQNYLREITQGVVDRQLENTHQVYDELLRKGYQFPRREEVLADNGGKLYRPADNGRLLREHGYASDWQTALRMIREAGFRSIMADMAMTVDAAHRSGAVCLIAHPGRREGGFTFYDIPLLDEVRAEIPLDGIEVYHPYHSPEIVQAYLEYVHKHNLLLSTGSDSHSIPGRMPIKYRAEISRDLLERVGIIVAALSS
ncbi:MAG TPA: PHP domain-containing protein [Ktedonobacteraceae bacterium]|nr:PHP domain-containing protein [Ktedonobacteraceae bacterium]